MTKHLALILLFGLAAGACNAPVVTPPECDITADCAAVLRDGVSLGSGYLCISHKCENCLSDNECQGTMLYGAAFECRDGLCIESECPELGVEGCGCKPGNSCNSGLLCEAGTCVAAEAGCTAGTDRCVCKTDSTCDAPMSCIDNRCVTCSGDRVGCPCVEGPGSCGAGLQCDDGTCKSCAPGALGCSCDAAAGCFEPFSCLDSRCIFCSADQVGCPCVGSACVEGLVCALASDTCRAPLVCSQITCVEHQLCSEPALADARCLSSCDPGYTWNAGTRRCDPALNCVAGAPNSILADCQAAHRDCVAVGTTAECGPCALDWVLEGAACRAVTTCADLGCAGRNQNCIPEGDHSDAVCGTCFSGFTPSAGGGSCRPVLTCTDIDCPADDRTCIPAGEFSDARCGSCIDGFVQDGTECRAVLTCEERDCAGANRNCAPPEVHADAQCTGCVTGYLERDGFCVPDLRTNCEVGHERSILAGCYAQNRECVEETDGASCGECRANFVENPATGLCEAFVSCSDPTLTSQCDALNRLCDEIPNGQCATCKPGFTGAATGACREVYTCCSTSAVSCDADEVRCSPGQWCVDESTNADAYCAGDACTDSQVVNLEGDGCVSCPACKRRDGSPFAWFTGVHDPQVTEINTCICQTATNWFWSESDLLAYACDEDGDGWVREKARVAMDSLDPVIRRNARCAVRTIDRVRLETAGDTVLATVPLKKTILLSALDPLLSSVQLYETDRNDSDTLLELFPVPGYSGGGRPLRASELNRLTKACVDAAADFNDNDIIDVDEWDRMGPAPGFPQELVPLNRFSYFVEMARGWYESPSTYVIREKSRESTAAPGLAIDLTLGDELRGSRVVPPLYEDGKEVDPTIGVPGSNSPQWRECDMNRDFEYDPLLPTVALDFTRYDTPGTGLGDSASWRGMNLSTLFKCVRVVDATEDSDDHPNYLTTGEIAAEHYQVNSCSVASSNEPPSFAHAVNPDDGELSCTRGTAAAKLQPVPNTVRWVGVEYRDHVDLGQYERGCVNECLGYPFFCPGYFHDASVCLQNSDNHGERACYCADFWGGPVCEIPCPQGEYYGDGFFACFGQETLTEPRVFTELPTEACTEGYCAAAHAPFPAAKRDAMCEDPSCASGFVVR